MFNSTEKIENNEEDVFVNETKYNVYNTRPLKEEK